MKEIVVAGNDTVQLKETDEPVPKNNEALIETKTCGICGSEMGSYHAASKDEKNTGHEAAGIVERPGKSGLLKKGDRVVLCVASGCGECENCRTGHENYCPDMWAKGRSAGRIRHAEKIAFVERNCLKIPEDMDFETAIATGGCGIGVAWHGIKRLDVRKGTPVLVFGVGPIGLAAVTILNHMGARPIAIDISEYRLNLAVKLGAIEKIKTETTGNSGQFLADLKKRMIKDSILCTGNHQAANNALLSLAPLGRLLVLGGLSGWQFNSFNLIGVGDKSIFGSWHYHRVEWPEIIGLVKDGLPVREMVTHVFPFSKAQEAYAMFAGGNTGKVILKPEAE